VTTAEIGLVAGGEYTLDLFQAEHHVTQSNLRIDTIARPRSCTVN
jgi:hypothetical protein